MLQEESDLSLVIAQIVQKLKGSNLYAQLERQAWVSEAGREGTETGGAAGKPALRLPPAGLGGSRRLVLGLRASARKRFPRGRKLHLPGLARGVADLERRVGRTPPFRRPEHAEAVH